MISTLSLPKWMDEGVCAQSDPDAFYPERGHSATAAKELCLGCPVRVRCLEYALANQERFGVWGGLSERERRALAANEEPPAPAERDYTAVDALLREGKHGDVEIARLCDMPKSTVHRRRGQLDLAPQRERRTPLKVYADLTRATGNGHRAWTGSSHVAVQGRYYSPARLAFLAGHGREPEGNVRPTCGLAGCVASAHLADRAMRAGQVAA
jgi:WhiB family redox-sensing transcriptional regulator